MIESTGNIWNGLEDPQVDAICVTTNGVLKRNGALVMGAGIALQARQMFPGIDAIAGPLVELRGNVVHPLWTANGTRIVSFPTKNNWLDQSSISLILRSAGQLVELADNNHWGRVLLTRPGCGNGGLSWVVVRKVIEPLLDDRFVVVTPPRLR